MKTNTRKLRKMRVGEIIQDGDRKTFGKGWIYADRHSGKPVDRENTYFTYRPQPSSS